jgi:hypothetical protein
VDIEEERTALTAEALLRDKGTRNYEQVVIEGGGSPAEINLRPSDSGRQTSLPLLSSATDRQIACHLVISWGACPPSETSYNCAFS